MYNFLYLQVETDSANPVGSLVIVSKKQVRQFPPRLSRNILVNKELR
jgi:hypothetical protein